MRVIGVDPGIHGAVCLFDSDTKEIAAFDLPILGEGSKQELDARWILNWIINECPDVIYIENATAMPSIAGEDGKRRGMGATSAFKFGFGVGQLRAVLQISASPFILVTPQKWKGHFKLKGRDKELSRQLALHLHPASAAFLKFKKDHQKAEALLIACYGVMDQTATAAQPSMDFTAGTRQRAPHELGEASK